MMILRSLDALKRPCSNWRENKMTGQLARALKIKRDSRGESDPILSNQLEKYAQYSPGSKEPDNHRIPSRRSGLRREEISRQNNDKWQKFTTHNESLLTRK